MFKSLSAVVLATAFATACSGGSAPQSNAASQAPAAAPAPAPAPAGTPSAAPPPAAASAAPTTPAAQAPVQAQPQPAQPQTQPAPTPSAAQSSAAAGSQPSSAAAAPAPEPRTPPAPKFREVTIPAETPLSVTLETTVASNKSNVEDQIRGTLAKSIVVSGTTVVPAGAELTGSILDAKESGRVKGKASVAFRFDRINIRGESHRIQTARIAREAGSSTKSDVKKGAVGAGAGAVIGGIAGGGSGAAIGAGVGGAATVLATKGKEVELPAGTMVGTRLMESVKVLVPTEK